MISDERLEALSCPERKGEAPKLARELRAARRLIEAYKERREARGAGPKMVADDLFAEAERAYLEARK
jgi:hypothetical protein